MSDRIQEQRPSALPYALGGAAVGGVGGYFGATKVDGLRKYVSEPAKYESFDALVEAANKADEFTKAAAEASEAEKPLMEQISTKVKEAEANWQKQLDEHIANGSKVADTDEIKVLEKELNELKAAQAKEVAAPATKTVTKATTPSRADALGQQLAKTKSDIKAYQTVQGWQNEMAELEKQLNPSQKEEFAKYYEALIKGDEKGVAEQLKQLKKIDNLRSTEIAAPQSTKLEQLVSDLSSGNARIKTSDPEKAKNAIQGKIDRNTQIGKELDALVDTNARRIAQTEPKASSEAIKKAEQAIETKVNSLYGVTKEQKAELLKQAKAELTERTVAVERNLPIEQRLESLKAQFNDLPEAARKRYEEKPQFIEHQIKNKTAEAEKLTKMQEIAQKREKHIKEMWKNRAEARRLEGTKVVDLTVGDIGKAEKGIQGYQSFASTLTNEEQALYKEMLKETRGRKAQTVVETVATDAKASTQNSAKIENLTKQIAEKRKALVGDSKANVEQLTKEFIEKNGSKETARNSAINSMKDDVAALFEGKINNKKLAIGVAAVATAGLALGLLLRPNAKEQA